MKTKTNRKPEKSGTELSEIDENLVNTEDANETGRLDDEDEEPGEEEYVDEDDEDIEEDDDDEYGSGFRGRSKFRTRSRR